MTLITFQDGKPLMKDGKIGTEQECCCKKCQGPCDEENPCPEGCVCRNGVCVEATDSCCGWSCDYVADIEFPDIEDPEDIPDISAGMIAAGWVFRDGVGYVKTITGEVDCDDPESVTVKAAQLEAEVDAIVEGDGGVCEDVALIPEVSGFGCLDGLTQEECEETYSGTFREGVRCDEEPCEENPLP
jgi:hypothetical protein